MSKRKGGFNAPIGEVADAVKGVVHETTDVVKEVVGEAGKTVRGHQDNRTKRYVSDNDTGVKHHELDILGLGKRFDFVVDSLGRLIDGVGAIGREINEPKRIDVELKMTREQEETKRQKIRADLEAARDRFATARKEAADHHESWQKNYQTAVEQFRSAWDGLLELVKSDGISEETRKSFLTQMSDLQRSITDITISYFEKDSAK